MLVHSSPNATWATDRDLSTNFSYAHNRKESPPRKQLVIWSVIEQRENVTSPSQNSCKKREEL